VPLAFSLLFDRLTHQQLHDQPAGTQVAPPPPGW
jgi:hypothetical protein